MNMAHGLLQVHARSKVLGSRKGPLFYAQSLTSFTPNSSDQLFDAHSHKGSGDSSRLMQQRAGKQVSAQGRIRACAANFLNRLKKASASFGKGLDDANKVTTSRITWGLVKGLAVMPCMPALARL